MCHHDVREPVILTETDSEETADEESEEIVEKTVADD